MKNFLKKSIVVAAGCVSLAALAADGSLTIAGTVTANTCTINGTAQGTSLVIVPIALGNVAATSFPGAGRTGGIVPSASGVNLTGCGSGTVVSFVLDGTGAIDTGTGTYTNQAATTPASNMAAQVMNTTTQTAIAPNGSTNITVTADASGAATIPVGARFYSLGAVTPGNFSTVAGFNLLYP